MLVKILAHTIEVSQNKAVQMIRKMAHNYTDSKKKKDFEKAKRAFQRPYDCVYFVPADYDSTTAFTWHFLAPRSCDRSCVAKFFRRRDKFFRPRENLGKKSLGRRDRFRPKIVEIGAILAIFEPFDVWKFTSHFWANSADRPEIHCIIPPIVAQISGRSAEFAKKWRVKFWNFGIFLSCVWMTTVSWWCDIVMMQRCDAMMIWWWYDMMIWW